MANQQSYTKADVYINSNKLAESASVTISTTSGKQPVKTMAKGLAGFTKGAGMTEIDVSNAVPSIDFEFDPTQFMFGDDDSIELTIYVAGRTLTLEGSITSCNFSFAVDSASKLDFKFTGGEASWE